MYCTNNLIEVFPIIELFSLGFAGGVMLAASYWSLLEPALEMAASMETYGKDGEWSFIPVAVGFFLGMKISVFNFFIGDME